MVMSRREVVHRSWHRCQVKVPSSYASSSQGDSRELKPKCTPVQSTTTSTPVTACSLNNSDRHKQHCWNEACAEISGFNETTLPIFRTRSRYMASQADLHEPVAELITFQSKECYVYVPLPPATTYGHRAELWNVDKWFKVR